MHGILNPHGSISFARKRRYRDPMVALTSRCAQGWALEGYMPPVGTLHLPGPSFLFWLAPLGGRVHPLSSGRSRQRIQTFLLAHSEWSGHHTCQSVASPQVVRVIRCDADVPLRFAGRKPKEEPLEAGNRRVTAWQHHSKGARWNVQVGFATSMVRQGRCQTGD